jgi:hypothetical protein
MFHLQNHSIRIEIVEFNGNKIFINCETWIQSIDINVMLYIQKETIINSNGEYILMRMEDMTFEFRKK